MRQVVVTPTPPPTPNVPQSFGEQIGQAARDIAQTAIAEARAEIQAQLAEAQAERLSLQAQIDAAQSSRVRRDLQRELTSTELKIEKLQEALAKLDAKVVARPSRTFSGGGTFAGTTPPPSFPNPVRPFDPTELVATSLGILFVAFPLTLAVVRFLWKRATPAPSPALSQEQTQRFDRLEQSVDAIAIEVERISENQRYLTKLLAESKPSAKLGA